MLRLSSVVQVGERITKAEEQYTKVAKSIKYLGRQGNHTQKN